MRCGDGGEKGENEAWKAQISQAENAKQGGFGWMMAVVIMYLVLLDAWHEGNFNSVQYKSTGKLGLEGRQACKQTRAFPKR